MYDNIAQLSAQNEIWLDFGQKGVQSYICESFACSLLPRFRYQHKEKENENLV